MWTVYVIFNSYNRKIYIGSTNDIARRLREHNTKSGNHFTARFSGEWVMVYSEKITTKHSALIREKQLKGFKGREFIKQFIPQNV